MAPSIGRIVHYTTSDVQGTPTTLAAIITAIHADGMVALFIFYLTRPSDLKHVPFSDVPKHGHWNWPPRI